MIKIKSEIVEPDKIKLKVSFIATYEDIKFLLSHIDVNLGTGEFRNHLRAILLNIEQQLRQPLNED